METIINEIKRFISKKTRIPVDEITNSVELLNSGVISSLAVLELIMHLEKIYKIEIGGDELTPKNLKDIQSLATLIHSKVPSLEMV